MLEVLGIAGAALSAIGVGSSIFGSILGNDANQEALAAQQKAEQIRQQAAAADAERRRRAAIRQNIILQSQAVARTTAVGANESSALPGAKGQISQETGWTIEGINQAQFFGRELYGANQELLQAKKDQANASLVSDVGRGLTSLGGSVISNMGTIKNIVGPDPFNIVGGVGKATGQFTVYDNANPYEDT